MPARILLVDDNEEFLDSTRDVLEDEGYQVVTAASGEQALGLQGKDAFDVVLMDIKMPGMNGVETLVKMKANNRDVKVILLTAFSWHELVHRAYEEGACAVFNKPLDPDRLLETIARVRARGSRRCILLADDDTALCASLHDILSQEGYRVVIARDSEEAVKKAQQGRYDIMLLDMKLPPLDGLAAYRRIRPLQPGLVAIIISAYMEEMADSIRQALEENVHACLPKPFDVGRLLELLKQFSAGA